MDLKKHAHEIEHFDRIVNAWSPFQYCPKCPNWGGANKPVMGVTMMRTLYCSKCWRYVENELMARGKV